MKIRDMKKETLLLIGLSGFTVYIIILIGEVHLIKKLLYSISRGIYLLVDIDRPNLLFKVVELKNEIHACCIVCFLLGVLVGFGCPSFWTAIKNLWQQKRA